MQVVWEEMGQHPWLFQERFCALSCFPDLPKLLTSWLCQSNPEGRRNIFGEPLPRDLCDGWQSLSFDDASGDQSKMMCLQGSFFISDKLLYNVKYLEGNKPRSCSCNFTLDLPLGFAASSAASLSFSSLDLWICRESARLPACAAA